MTLTFDDLTLDEAQALTTVLQCIRAGRPFYYPDASAVPRPDPLAGRFGPAGEASSNGTRPPRHMAQSGEAT